jgi:sugar phosphate isomerase/epimerase
MRHQDGHPADALASLEGRGKVIEVGRGILDVKGILRALVEIMFDGHVGFEASLPYALSAGTRISPTNAASETSAAAPNR